MKRIYLIKYTRDFSNTYSLRYVQDGNKEALELAMKYGYERISRKEAISKAKEEIDRREYDQSFSGFADACVYPFEPINGYDEKWREPERKYPYIVEM